MKERNALGRAVVLGLSVLAVLNVVWVLPPAMHRALHLCPVRPDGVSQAHAVPSYARKYGVDCSMCHTVWPILNDVGRKFKENGYVIDREGENKEASGTLFPKTFPASIVVKSQFFEKPMHSKPAIKGISDFAWFITDGSIAKNFSIWSEFHNRAFDPGATPSGFGFNFERARLGWHPSPYANVLVGFGSIPEGMDTYETLESPDHTVNKNNVTQLLDHQKQFAGVPVAGLTAAQEDPNAFDQQYLGLQGAADPGFGSIKYWTAVGAGWGAPSSGGADGAGTDASLGQGPMNYNFRLVYDTLKGATLGGYYQTGHNDWTDAKTGKGVNNVTEGASFLNNVQTWAVDSVVEFKGLTARTAFIKQRISVESDPTLANKPGKSLSNRQGFYVESLYSFKKNNAPWLAPLVRYEMLGDVTNTAKRLYKDYVVASLNYFPYENVHGTLEYWLQSKLQTAGQNAGSDNKVTFQVAVGF